MSYNIFIASRSYSKYSPETKKFLQNQDCKLEYNKLDKVYKEEDLLKIVDKYDCLVVGVDEVTEKVIKKGDNLKVIAKNGIGVDNINLAAADKAGIPVVNIPGANSQSVADLSVALMLSLARAIPVVNNLTKSGNWQRIIGRELWGKKVGIIGTGNIGRLIAKRVKDGFNCEILAFDIDINQNFAKDSAVSYFEFNEVIEKSDFISLNVPLTSATKNLIDKEELKNMKETAYLINTARGGVVNEDELYQALKNKEIAGAACDVFAKEPPGEHKLFELDNFLATSHIGAFTYETNQRAGMGLAKDIVAVLKGEKPENLVNNPDNT